MMNIQEREEMDFYPMTSMQQAYAGDLEMAKFDRVDRGEVARLASFGFYVVIEAYSVFGMDTDAFLGYSEAIACVTRSIDEAEAEAEAIWEREFSAEVVHPEPFAVRGITIRPNFADVMNPDNDEHESILQEIINNDRDELESILQEMSRGN